MTPSATTPGHVALVVEDDGIALPLSCVLERAGHQVQRVDRLADATRGDGPVSLVVVDVAEGDRRALVRDLGELPPEPAVLLLTPGPGPHGWTGAVGGDVAVLPKPFAIGELQTCLRVLMGPSASRVPAPRRTSAVCPEVDPESVVGQVPQNVV